MDNDLDLANLRPVPFFGKYDYQVFVCFLLYEKKTATAIKKSSYRDPRAIYLECVYNYYATHDSEWLKIINLTILLGLLRCSRFLILPGNYSQPQILKRSDLS